MYLVWSVIVYGSLWLSCTEVACCFVQVLEGRNLQVWWYLQRLQTNDMLRWCFRQSESLKRSQRKITMVLVWDQFTPLWYFIYIYIYSIYSYNMYIITVYIYICTVCFWYYVPVIFIDYLMALNLPDSRTNSRLAAKKLQRSSPEPHPSVSSSPSRGKGMENLSFFSGGDI